MPATLRGRSDRRLSFSQDYMVGSGAVVAVEIRLSATEVARVRFAVSPLAETVLAVRTVLGVRTHAVYGPWLRTAPATLAEAVTTAELELLRTLLGGLPPSFLFPVPESRLPSLEEELTHLRATEPQFVAAECTAAVGARAGRLPVPTELTAILADVLERCHERLIAPQWARMLAVLEADMGRRALVLVERGVEGLFTELHHDVVWREGELRLHGDRATRSGAGCTVEVDGHGVVLMPTVFGWPEVLVDCAPRTAAAIRYPATGVAPLWERPRTDYHGTAAVLGRTRAAILAALADPLTTPDLAARVTVTPSAVSQHLNALRAAGLVTTLRSGRTALHRRTALGTALGQVGAVG
ncbi:DUF5937 family protein [Kitasatospora sp. NPDC096147]|uniref:ArsR/SmtB family transcription factor n=1 Tax=Kitasatospora sp. NPDC096147 TaxID=3364093 RepID=UPI00380D0FDE